VTSASFAPASNTSYTFATAQEGGEVLLWSLDPYVSSKMTPRKVIMGKPLAPLPRWFLSCLRDAVIKQLCGIICVPRFHGCMLQPLILATRLLGANLALGHCTDALFVYRSLCRRAEVKLVGELVG